MTARIRPIRVGAGFSVGILVTGLLAVTGAAPAAADPAVRSTDNGVTVDRDGTVHYQVDLAAVPGYTIVSDTGVKQPNGACGFSESNRGKVTGKAQVLIITDLSINPDTCARQTVRAQYSLAALPASVQARLDAEAAAEKSENSTDKTEAPSGRSADATVTAGPWFGKLYVATEDPVFIDTTSTQSQLTWSFDGTFLYGNHVSSWDWFWPTGWYATSLIYGHQNFGSYAYTQTRGSYVNDLFCNPFANTYSEHRDTYFEGWYDGWWYWSYYVEWWGDCASLLHHTYTVQTP